eukprot:1267654-Pyramimonas_sp.AAC.1
MILDRLGAVSEASWDTVVIILSRRRKAWGMLGAILEHCVPPWSHPGAPWPHWRPDTHTKKKPKRKRLIEG